MKIYTIYIADDQGMFVICAENEEQAKRLLLNDSESPFNEIELDEDMIDIYESEELLTNNPKPRLISWMLNENF